MNEPWVKNKNNMNEPWVKNKNNMNEPWVKNKIKMAEKVYCKKTSFLTEENRLEQRIKS